MNVKSALRVVEIVEVFARERQPLALSELARLLAMPVSSCLGLVRTLEGLGWLYEVSRRQGYYPTGRLLSMAQQIAANDPVLERVRPTLQELRDTSGETVLLTRLRDDARVVYLDVIDSPHRIRYAAQAGEMRDAHVNSAGRALLAALPAEERARVLAQATFTRHTPKTLASAKALEAELAASRERGWFANLGETLPDLAGVAWPFALAGQVYAISVVGPTYRIEPHAERFAAMLRAACAAIEKN